MFVIHKYAAWFQKLCQTRIRVIVLGIFLIAFAVFSFQSFTLAPGNGSSPLFPVFWKGSSPIGSSTTSEERGEVSVPNDSKNSSFPAEKEENRGLPVAGGRDEPHNEMGETEGEPDGFDLDTEESEADDELSVDLGNGVIMKRVKGPQGGYITLEKPVDAGDNSSLAMDGEPGTRFKSTSSKESKTNSSLRWDGVRNLDNSSQGPSLVSHQEGSHIQEEKAQVRPGNKSSGSLIDVSANFSSAIEANHAVARGEEKKPSQSSVTVPSCVAAEDRVVSKSKRKPVVTISDMNQILSRNRRSSCPMIPRWSSPADEQILKAKKQIMNAPIVEDDPELYSPAFRNVSMFKRSYQLMEKVLKVYVYKEGDKPIFHQPPLTGIYASEGWFMKHMEASKRFVVDDPSKAHLFYIPFSSNLLVTYLYVPDSHSKKNLIEHLSNYRATITAKYPFWNRTGGADHFVVACHDWAPAETRQLMGNTLRALCTADVTVSFVLGKDVSLPQTNVRTPQGPLRDLGGRPPKKRPLLAFFAGQMHGYLRPLLLQHWENKDPDMKIFGPLQETRGRRKSMTYAQYMTSSRYCVCPRGYEANSPRVVEAIYYGCVPVIVSDNYVLPFFEVLNWEAFSVVVAEKDLPRLKEILVAIPRKKYLALQVGLRKVQKHFLWHDQPVKYDMFHMILHSVWFNRVFTFHAESK